MSKHQGLVVAVEFKVKPGAMPTFLDLITRHARTTLESEPGCLQFDVMQDPAHPSLVFLYEVYADEAAFAAHEAAPYLARTLAAVADLVESSSIRKLQRHSHPQKARGAVGKVLVAPSHLAQRRELLQPLVAAGLELVFNPFGRALSAAEMIGLLPGVVATLAGGEPYSEQVLSQAPDLKVVARLGVGHDAIDLRAATRHGVAIAMAFGTNHEPVADMAFTLMAAVTHRLLDYHRRVETGSWGPLFHGRMHGTTIGIVGFGRIGRAVAKRCQGFNMEVLVADPVMDADTVARLGCTLMPLDELLAASDIVSLHAPLTPDTRRLIDARRLSLMRPDAFLINTARGGLVDEAALVAALEGGRLAGAGLDVFAVEPLPVDSPLLRLPNVVMTPHVAGSSEWSVGSMTRRAVESILDVLRGEDPGGGLVLNPEVLKGEHIIGPAGLRKGLAARPNLGYARQASMLPRPNSDRACRNRNSGPARLAAEHACDRARV